ncbi:MAG: peptide-methionine (S)-S-oxide reductase MsrA [Candidatus Margulisiibacteriota bacterium]
MATEKSVEQKAVFAGGCFWCMQPPFDDLPGVISTRVGYSGGTVPNPTYEAVCTGKTGHFEAIEVVYNPQKVSFKQLIERFWTQIDPTDAGGQFADQGTQYQTAIFYKTTDQKAIAEASKKALEKSGKFSHPIATQILPEKTFYPAEEGHQGYYKKNPFHYNAYKQGSGRAAFIRKNWGH